MSEGLRFGELSSSQMTDAELAEAALAEVTDLKEILHEGGCVPERAFYRLGLLFAGLLEIKWRSNERD